MKLTGLHPRSRVVETLDTPKHCTLAGYYDYSPPAHFGLGVGRRPAGLHQEEP